MHRSFNVSLLLLWLVSACDETAVSLVIHSKLKIPQELDALCVQLAAGGQFQFGQRYPLGAEDAGRPLTLSVLPGDRNDSNFETLLRGERRGWPVARVRESVGFETHAVRESHLYLERCAGPTGTGDFAAAQRLTPDPGSVVAGLPVALSPAEAVAIWSGNAQRVAWLGGQMKVLPEGVPGVAPQAVNDVTAVDVDGDCDLDLVVLQQGAPQVWIHGPGGVFEVRAGALSLTGDFDQVAAADLNLDGAADLVLVSATAVKLLLNNGDGSFRDGSANLPASLTGVTGVGIGFINRGGDPTQPDDLPDIVLARGGGQVLPSLVLINRYSGPDSLNFDQQNLLTSRDSRSLAVGDLDGDGLHDVVLSSVGEKPLLLLNRSDGTGLHFEERTEALADAGVATVLDQLAVDIDNDCDLDLVLARDAGTVTLLNDGQGGFSPAPGGAQRRASDLAVVDMDGDGLQDVLLGGDPSGAHWLRQKGPEEL